ncbi:MAG: hypothetical protein GF364_03265 [Candidatus Lokiarchaeota archaeon]|nr:hypothetical protein [Candidatus Lokiarchaeota archaeon]
MVFYISKLRFGLVGYGTRGKYWIFALRSKRDVDMVAVCDIREKAAKKAATLSGADFYTDNYEEFIKQDLDAIVIATPHFLHAPQTILAAENEINVLCEKPMAITLKECDDMIRAANQNDIKLSIGFQHRFDEQYIKMKQAIDAGALGDIFQINLSFRKWRSEMYYEQSTHHWRGRWTTEGGGVLINQAVHFIDLFQWLGGDIENIFASAKISRHEFQEVEDNVNAIVNFKNGAHGQFHSAITYDYDKGIELGIYGTKASLVWRNHKLHNSMTRKAKRNSFWGDLKKNLKHPHLENFIQSIKEDDKSIISVNGEEGRKSIEFIRGIYMSEISGRKVRFPVNDNGTFPTLGRYYKTEWENL